MKLINITLLVLFFSVSPLLGQENAALFLSGNKLIGDCDDPYFSGFEIELDTVLAEIDSFNLFRQLPRMGTINFKHKHHIPTEFTITDRAGYNQVMFRFRSSWHTFDDLKFDGNSITFSINRDPIVPATKEDIEIIRLARKMLSEEKYWNSKDDRSCEDDIANKCYSLYCALKIASVEIANKYNHRNAVLQKLRHIIVEKYPDKIWNHRLMDFNNMEETTYETILELLDEMESAFEKEMQLKTKED